MFDKMSARCAALNVASGERNTSTAPACSPTPTVNKIFSTFDTRDLDKSQPKMDCGTHVITGGTGKYEGISGTEPFACIKMPALAGAGDYTAMDIPHNTTWEFKSSGATGASSRRERRRARKGSSGRSVAS